MKSFLENDPPFDDYSFSGKYVTTFRDIADEDLDDPPDPDEEGDDSFHDPQRPEGFSFKMPPPQAPIPAPIRIVTHHRDIKMGNSGVDVVALKRALARKGFYPPRKKRTRFFGYTLKRSLIKFQASKGLSNDGVYGTKSHAALVKAGGFDRYGAYLMTQAPFPIAPELKKRQDIVGYWTWAYHNRDTLFYLQRRPMRINSVYELPSWEDCSEFITRGYKTVGGPDPNGLNFNGLGYTGTMANHGVRTSSPKPADANLYGLRWTGYRHTTGQISTVENGDLCYSMGSSIGPLLLRRRYRFDYAETRSYL